MARQTSSGPYLITTSPSLITCCDCKRPVLAATIGGLDRHIDTACLNQLGELAALLEGRSTFELVGDVFYRRGPEKIRSGARRGPVMAAHAHKEVSQEHIDPAWLEAATAIVINAVGGVIVGNDRVAHFPPF